MGAAFRYDTFPTGLPVGRFVQGNLYEAQVKTDQKTGQPQIHPAGHAQAGQPVKAFYILVAYAKNDPAWPAFRNFLAAAARTDWPQYHDAAGNCTNPTFATKIIDGDGKDEKGRPWSEREGFAGHWVVRYGTTFAPKVVKWDESMGAWAETAKDEIKLGDYIKVSGSTQTNKSAQSPGMHVNPELIAFVREGERIVLGVTADAAFGPGPGGAAPAPGTTPPPPTPAAPAPAPGGPVMTAAATATYEQYKATGWTDEQLIQNGLMVAPAAATPPPPTPAPPPPAQAAPPPPTPPAPPYNITDKAAGGPVMTAAANGVPYADYIAKGWTDEQLIQHGLMQA